jgi:hypothetical protein
MANTTTTRKKRSGEQRSRAQQRPRSRRRARARRAASRRVQREFRAAGTELRQARADVRRASTNVRQAGENVLQAGEAGMSAAREAAEAAGARVGRVAGKATRRVGEAAEIARERVSEVADVARERMGEAAIDAGRAAVEVAEQLLHLPELVREGARRSVELVETAGTRAVVGVIQAGTKVLSKAADYVSELSPRRRVQRQALEQLVIEQITWAHAGTEAYDRTVDETEDTGTRMRLVRFKLQTIKQAEALSELLREIGGRLPPEEEAPPPPIVPGRNGHHARGPAAARHGLAHGLTIAVQSAEGWRALNRIGALAEQDRVAEAILRVSEAVGSEPDEQVEFLRQALLEKTVESVLA